MAKIKKSVEKVEVAEQPTTFCPLCESRQEHTSGLIYACKNGHETGKGYTAEEIAELKERRDACKVRNAIHIQIGDDEGEHKDLFYEIWGVQGDFTLTTYRKFKEWNDIDRKFVSKKEKIKRYYPTLSIMMKMIMAYEITDKHAATLPELLKVLQSIDERLESLSETLFELSVNKQDETE